MRGSGEPPKRGMGPKAEAGQGRRVGREQEAPQRAPPALGTDPRENWAPEGPADNNVFKSIRATTTYETLII